MIEQNPVEYSMFLIFIGAALLATIALYARQAMLVGYIILGILLGPWGLSLVNDPDLIKDISHIGIIFLLYLLGLDLLPQQLWKMLGEALEITLLSSFTTDRCGHDVFEYHNWPEIAPNNNIASPSHGTDYH